MAETKIDPIMQECDFKTRQIIEAYRAYSHDPSGDKIWEAYEYAKQQHAAQKRATGEPYIVHPIAVTEILTELNVDEETLIAAFLHDTVEDTGATLEDISARFGDEVAMLVDGVTKLGKFKYSSREELQAENFRKMFLAISKDIRVVLIKLADRLHNLRTLKHKNPERQVAIAQETLDIYAPLAHRLGIYKIKWELEDLCLRFLEPEAFYELVGSISQKRDEREKFLENIVVELSSKISAMGIQADVEGRPKHFYSIYRKMKAQDKTLDEIYDLFATRIIVPTVGDCYAVLGMVHELYKPMPGRFKDYIAMPKPNRYQSLHTTVIGPRGIPFEVQIRTYEMHRIAEYGIAAHWRYKEGITDQKTEPIENKLTWLRQLLEWSNDLRDAKEYMETLRDGLIEDEVFVFTPKGKVVSLPAGAVPIDFAYHIHSAVGNSMYGAKVNGHMVSMDYQLKNGDIIEILTSDKVKGPSRDWLRIVKSTTARNKISSWFKKSMRGENIVKGREILEREIKKAGFEPHQLLAKAMLEPVLARYTFSCLDDLYAAVGYGGVSAGRVIPRLRDEYIRSLPPEERAKLGYRINQNGTVIYSPNTVLDPEAILAEEHPSLLHEERPRRRRYGSGVEVRGIDNALTKLASCCSPVPGDSIIGYVTRGSGVTVHRADCKNILHLMEVSDRSPKDAERASRLIDVFWADDENSNRAFQVELKIIARDRPRLLLEISNAISEEQVPILSGRMQSARDFTASFLMHVELKDQAQLDKLCGRLKAIQGVMAVTRG